MYCLRSPCKEWPGSELEPSFLPSMEMEGGSEKSCRTKYGCWQASHNSQERSLPCKMWYLADKEANWLAECRAFWDAEMQISPNHMQLWIWGWRAKQRPGFFQAALKTHFDGWSTLVLSRAGTMQGTGETVKNRTLIPPLGSLQSPKGDGARRASLFVPTVSGNTGKTG